MVVSDCDNAVGDSYFVVNNENGDFISSGFQNCPTGDGAVISFEVPSSVTSCVTWSLHEGCYADGECSGTTTIGKILVIIIIMFIITILIS